MHDLEKRVLRKVGESVTSPDVFTDDDVGLALIRGSLNEAIQEVNMVSGGYEESIYLPLRKDVTHYRLQFPQDHFGWVRRAELLGQRRELTQANYNDLEQMDARWLERSGPPRWFFHAGLDVIGIWPRPTADDDIVEVKAVIIPGEYSLDTDRIKVREEFQDGLVNYAVGEYWASRGDAKAAEGHFQLYMDMLGTRLSHRSMAERDYTFGRDREATPLPERP